VVAVADAVGRAVASVAGRAASVGRAGREDKVAPVDKGAQPAARMRSPAVAMLKVDRKAARADLHRRMRKVVLAGRHPMR
jgi:hypothetical protein